jgi:hypothetical protein
MKIPARCALCCALVVGASVPWVVHGQPKEASAPAASAAIKARISSLPARPVELKRVDPTVATPAGKASPTPPAPAVATKPPAATTARYVPLPPPERAVTNEVLAQQLVGVKAARPDLPAFVAFKGALVTQTVDAAEVTLIPLVFVDDPLRFDPATNQFQGRIAVGLVELGVKGPSKTLPAAVLFQTLGDVTANPEEAEVKSTSPPFRTVVITARDPRDKVELRVFSTGMEPIVVAVPVERARLQLSAKTQLQGWGLESTEVVVSASNGAASKGQEVELHQPPLGTLSPTTVRLLDNGRNTARLRSESIGTVQLTASSAALGAPEPLTIDFQFPARFLVAGLLGGLVGAFLRKGLKRTGTRRLVFELALGVLTGALVLGLFVLGVNVTGFPLPSAGGEALLFVVAALGAYTGTQLLQPKPRPAD